MTSATSDASRRPLTARWNPSAASARATPRPMPRAPPVTSATLRGLVEERDIGFVPRESANQQGQLQQMIIAPHARLAAGNLPPGWDMVPVVGPMVNRVEQQSLVLRFLRKIRR